MGKIVGEPYRGKPDVRFDERAKGMRPTGNPPLATVNTHLIPSQHQCSTLLLPDAPRPATIAAYYHPLGARRSALHNQRLQQTIPSANKLASGLAPDPRRFGLKDKRIHFKKYNKKIL